MAKEAKTSVTFYPIKAHLSALDVLLKDMEKRWLELGQGESILPELIKKKVLIKSGKIKGYIGLEKDKPVCVAWADLPHGSYGNMVVHAIKPRYQIPLVEQILSSGMVKGTVVELVQLVAGFEYRDAFCSVGFHEKERQRMIFEYDGVYQAPDISENVTFTPLSSDTVEAVGNISFAAHDIRSNIEGYYDFATPEQRSNMAKRLRDGKYGKTVDSACIMMAYDGEDAGLCDVIEMSCWGRHVGFPHPPRERPSRWPPNYANAEPQQIHPHRYALFHNKSLRPCPLPS